ncbi:hypothetical protein MC885_008965, partial [Smutsia gigantea]
EGKTQGPACLRVGMFNTAMGKLQQQLQKGEYDIFKSVPMFESDFFQITKQGELVDMHKNVRITTVGIVNTNPLYLIPDIMLLAQPVPRCKLHAGCGQATKGKGHKDTTTLELTRLFPLKLVKISVHNHDKHQLRVKLATGRSYYLQLCAPPDEQEDLFASWEGIIDLLRSQVQDYSSTHAVPAGTCFSKRTGGAPKQHISKEQKIRDRTVTKSASEQLSTALAGAATECPGGTKTNTATSGAANMCPEGIKMSLEGATNKASECTSSVSAILSLEDSVRVATAGAAPASKMGGEAMKGTGVSIGSLLSNVKARLSGRTKPQRGGHSGEDPHGDHPKE